MFAAFARAYNRERVRYTLGYGKGGSYLESSAVHIAKCLGIHARLDRSLLNL
jgi:hypothetical protein